MLMSNLLKFRGLYITNKSLVTQDDLRSRFIIGKNHQQEMVFSLADKNEPWVDVCRVVYFL
jgi:hypothetical protein